MNRKHGILLIGAVLLVFCAFVGTASSASTWYVDDDGGADFTTIQEAVNYASEGDTIIVRDGTYNENVHVNKSYLTLRSEDGAANCIIDAGISVFEGLDLPSTSKIEYVNINGFTVTGGSYGMHLVESHYSNISNNIISNCDDGIIIYYGDSGPGAQSKYNTVTSNTITNCSNGIYFYGGCNNNTITNNVVSNNEIGIRIDWADGSGYNSITNNIVSNNSMSGIALWSGAFHNTVANNTVSGGETDDTWGGGIDVRQSNYNIITNNTILAPSGGEVILFHDSGGNLIYNNYFDNMTEFFGVSYGNIWNITKTPGENIIGGPYLGGNYWSDYAGTDEDGDGLGDTPYEISDENTDYLPLVKYVSDTAPPDTEITAGPSEGETITYNDVTFRWTGSDDVTETSDLVYRYKLADGWSDWTPATSVVYIDLSNGAYTFTVEAKDQAGKVDPTPASRSFTVSVDTTRPETAITAGPSGTIYYNEVTFTWTGTDDRTDTSDLVYQYKYKTSDAWPETWTSDTSVTKVLSNGAYTFMVRAKDEAGNIDATPAERSFTVSVDTTPPETAITAGPSGTIDYNEVTFEWTGADDVTATVNLTYQYTLSDTWPEEWTPGTSVTYTDLSNGEYTFMVRARDEAGAVDPTPATRSFTVFVDTTLPETAITAGPSGTIDYNNVTFEWTGTDDRTVPSNLVYQYTWGDTWPEEWTSGTSVTRELPNGAYTFRVRARDEAGNIDPTPATRSFIIPGTTPPETTITSGPSGTIGYVNVTFTWTGTDDVSATSNLEYQYKLGDTWSEWVSVTNVTYTGLSNGDYTFMVRARDEAENEDMTPASRSFTVFLDTTPPETAITSGPSGTINYNDVTFEWTGTDEITETPNLVYQYKLDGSWSEWTSDTSKTYADLSNGEYMFMVRAKDEAGKEDPTPASRSFTVSVTYRRSSGGGGGGGTSLDSDGDGYFDTVEIMIGTDPNDPNDYPNKEAATPTPTTKTTLLSTTALSTVTTPPPTVTPTVPAPETTPEPATPTPEEPGFEAVFAVAGLLALAYVVLRRRG